MTTNKKIILYIFISITIIQIFTLCVTVANLWLAAYNGTALDYTPLTTLISSIVGEVGAYGIYALKSSRENSVGGITYDMAMLDRQEDEDVEELPRYQINE